MTSVVSATRSEFERVAWLLDISHCPLFSSDSQMYTSYWVLVLASFVGCAGGGGRWLNHEYTRILHSSPIGQLAGIVRKRSRPRPRIFSRRPVQSSLKQSTNITIHAARPRSG